MNRTRAEYRDGGGQRQRLVIGRAFCPQCRRVRQYVRDVRTTRLACPQCATTTDLASVDEGD